MTGKWVGWAADLPSSVKGPARLAAFVLADACDPDGNCTYGVKKLANNAAMSERAFQRATSSLERDGWITKHLNAVEAITVKGRTIHLKADQRPNQYVLHSIQQIGSRGDDSDTSVDVPRDDRIVTPPDGERGVENDTSRGDDSGTKLPDRGDETDAHSPYVPTGSPCPPPCADGAGVQGPPQLDIAPDGTGARFAAFFHDIAGTVRPLDEIRTATPALWDREWLAPPRRLVADLDKPYLAGLVRFAVAHEHWGDVTATPADLARHYAGRLRSQYDAHLAKANRRSQGRGDTGGVSTLDWEAAYRATVELWAASGPYGPDPSDRWAAFELALADQDPCLRLAAQRTGYKALTGDVKAGKWAFKHAWEQAASELLGVA